MSIFSVDIRNISEIKEHSNADRLEIAKVSGLDYQFIIGKGAYAVGDQVIYFPIDSVLPVGLSDLLGVTAYLSKGRVKTVKLRGEISQGLVCKADMLTELLGVVKYEPPVTFNNNCVLRPLPDGVYVYDIENIERAGFDGGEVSITEKLEGTNFALLVRGDEMIVCSHRRSVDEGDNIYWNASKELREKVKGRDGIYRGEICGPGIQGNIYGLKEPTLFLFEIEGMSFDEYEEFVRTNAIRSVPLLYVGEWNEFDADGISALAETLREGVVIRGRDCIVKRRSPEYLAKCG